MAFPGVIMSQSNGYEWIKTPRGWSLRQLPDTDVLSSSPPKLPDRLQARKDDKNENQQSCNIRVSGTKGKRRLSVCLSDFIQSIDLQGAVVDIRRQTYLFDTMYIFMKDSLSKVSGTTHKMLFKILEVMTNEALKSQKNIPCIKAILACTMKALIDGSSTRIGCKSVWNKHIHTVSNLCALVEQFQYTERVEDGMLCLTDLPKECLREIILKFSDHRDIIHLGQTCWDLYYMCQDTTVWEKITQYNYTEKQMTTFHENTDYSDWTAWQQLYHSCFRKYGMKQSYTDQLVICSACKTLHWMMIGHHCWPTTDTRMKAYLEPISPGEIVQILL